jgi:hypothetical protein
MATDIQPEWGEGPRIVGRALLTSLRVIGHTARLLAFSVLMLLAPLIRWLLTIAALGILFVCLVQLGVTHQYPFPYARGIAIAAACLVLRFLFNRLLIALAPEGSAPNV